MERRFTKCYRCGGTMIYEKIFYETEQFWVWKCVYCGEYIDQVILENRQIQNSNRQKSLKGNEGFISRSPSDPRSV